MKKYGFLAVLTLVIGFLFISSVLGNDTKIFRFKAETHGGMADPASLPNGKYEVVVSENGKSVEVFQIENETKTQIAGYTAEELAGMVCFDPDDRKQCNPPYYIGKKWIQSYNYRIPGISKTFRKAVTYRVVSEEDHGGTSQFKIEADARISFGNVNYDQKWVYTIDPATGIISKWHFDSAVGQKGAKIDIELIKLGE